VFIINIHKARLFLRVVELQESDYAGIGLSYQANGKGLNRTASGALDAVGKALENQYYSVCKLSILHCLTLLKLNLEFLHYSTSCTNRRALTNLLVHD
jgi:hypothetical protein